MLQAATVKHDIEAMAFCQGKPEGFYENPAACENYFFCWNQGKIYSLKVYQTVKSSVKTVFRNPLKF